MHTINAESEEDELERDTEYLKRHLATAKSQLMHISSQKQKLHKS
jgi:hypothetical protein